MAGRAGLRHIAAWIAVAAVLGAAVPVAAGAADASPPVDPRSVVPLLRADDLDALEARLAALEASVARTREGWLALPGAFAALGFAAAADPDIAAQLAVWIARRPDSWHAAMADGWRHLAYRSPLNGTDTGFDLLFVPSQRDDAALARAGAAFERAAALAPRSGEPAAGRIAVATLERAPIAERMALFERGCRFDAVCESARLLLLTSLEPHLGGSRELLLAFARSSAAEHPEDPRIGLLPAFAQRKIAVTMRRREEYVRRPGVFDEIEAAYERFLAAHPESVHHRNEYARVATWAGRREIARREFEAIGDAYVPEAWKGDFRRFQQARTWAMATSPGAGPAGAVP